MREDLIDTAIFVETPENIDLEAQLAGPVPRVLAYTIDVVIRGVVLSIMAVFLLFFERVGQGFFLVIAFLMEWFYPVFFEVYRQGQTPGKRRFGLAVVNEDLTPIGWGASMTRNLLRAADFLPLAYLLGLVSIVVSNKFQRLGDLAAGSIVIHQPPPQQLRDLPACKPILSPITLELEDQVALIDFTQRHNQLTDSRQQELADILRDITKQQPAQAVTFLRGVGVWLLGIK